MGNNNIILKLVSISLLAWAMLSCIDKSEDFKISGELENVEGTHFLAAYESGDSLVVDTIAIEDGQFSFRSHVDTLTVMRLYFNNNTKVPRLFVFVDKKWDVKIKGNILYPDLITVNGGDVNDDLTAFKKKNEDLLISQAKIMEVATNDNDSSSTEAAQKYIMDLKNLNFDLANIAAEYVRNNPTKIASVVIMNTFFRDETSVPRLDEALTQLKGRAEIFYLTDELKDFSQKVKRAQTGSMAPAFSLENLKKKNVNMNDYRGKYVLLAFASTICNECNAARKDEVKIYKELKNKKKNIEFATIMIDTEKKEIPKSARDSIAWSILPEVGSWSAHTLELYNVREVPYYILISPTGNIIERNIPIEQLPARLETLPPK